MLVGRKTVDMKGVLFWRKMELEWIACFSELNLFVLRRAWRQGYIF